MPGTKLFKFCTALYIINSYFYTMMLMKYI